MFELKDVNIQSGDIVIDCGANVGLVTEYFCRRGAKVFAFEPNIYAYKILEDKFKMFKNVSCFQYAVGTHKSDKEMKLYLHENAHTDQVKYSTGSSLVSSKNNVKEDDFLLVKIVVLSEFIKNINKPIKVLKIDIEGYEVELLNELIDSGVIQDIPYVFVETHEKKIPSLKKGMEDLREKIKDKNLTNINLDWI